MCTGFEIAAIVGAAAGLAQTGHSLAKGGPKMPALPKAAPAPPPPPPPAVAPPAALDTGAAEAVSKDKRKRQARYGIADTILSGPLGGSSAPGPTSTILGG